MTYEDNDFMISLEKHICSWRAWYLIGITCSHALSCISFMKHKVEYYVDQYCMKDNYMKTHKFVLLSFNGYKIWLEVDRDPILQCHIKKLPGRPKKKKKKRTNMKIKIIQVNFGGLD